jgi:hypothetical protein
MQSDVVSSRADWVEDEPKQILQTCLETDNPSGIRLPRPGKGPVDNSVIEHLEKPTEN